MKLIIASNNAHKISEIRDILGSHFGEILTMREAGIKHETVEDGQTFMENAVKKAREMVKISGCCALADDSGLCVDELDGGPGIYSARFAGVHGDDEANNDLLMEKLRDTENRGAHYTCAMALVYPDGRMLTAEGYLYGEIARERAGTNGFGYDPLFFLPERGCTTAQLSPEEKNAISHRANALHALVRQLEKQQA